MVRWKVRHVAFVSISFQVKPRSVTQDELINKTLTPGNEVEKALFLGAEMIAVQLINVVSNILNSQNDTTNYILEENQRVSYPRFCHVGSCS